MARHEPAIALQILLDRCGYEQARPWQPAVFAMGA